MIKPSEIMAEDILDSKALVIDRKRGFTFSSGIQSPVYCDLRVLLDEPRIREEVVTLLMDKVSRLCILKEVDVIVGVSTGGIPWASWLALTLGKRMAYVRDVLKGHGTRKQVEGRVLYGDRAIVVDDMITTGASAADAVLALREECGAVVGKVFSLMSYNLPRAARQFKEVRVDDFPLCILEDVLNLGKRGRLNKEDIEAAFEWLASLFGTVVKKERKVEEKPYG